MTQTNSWIQSGDRSDPYLKLIDGELGHNLTYEGHCEDLQRLEDAYLNGHIYECDDLVFYVRESQRIHEGDRSHPRLVKLDALRELLTYDGWEDDFAAALVYHKKSVEDFLFEFRASVTGMKRRQSMSIGDHSHENLRFLHSLNLSFPGWKKGVEHAVNHHRDGHCVEYYKFTLVEKQRMFKGVRSHPRLVALDSLRLTYPGWLEDTKEAERMHISSLIDYDEGIFHAYKSYLRLISSKQRAYETSADSPWVHPVQCKIIETNWTYSGWEADIESVRAEDCTTGTSDYTFEDWLDKCTLRQNLYDNNFDDHHALLKLAGLQLSYPGWETDFEDAKKDLHDNGYVLGFPFKSKVEGMKIKQTIYEGVPKAVEAKEEQPKSYNFGTCAICLEAPRTHIFVPCGHACACKSCSDEVMTRKRKCPICNTSLKLAMEFFFP
mmetsp:Transcript_576/g.1133  ORF Transcript_576/g.1133 Transcript_576/m.1133 type:complete len:436 (+) Transcript_576:96-1403(+)